MAKIEVIDFWFAQSIKINSAALLDNVLPQMIRRTLSLQRLLLKSVLGAYTDR